MNDDMAAVAFVLHVLQQGKPSKRDRQMCTAIIAGLVEKYEAGIAILDDQLAELTTEEK